MTPVMRSGLSVYQTSYDLLCQVLRKVLVDVVQVGCGAAGGIGSVECQAVATLYMLLMDHPIDRRGRCRSCRRPGAMFGSRWRRCRVYGKASVWLHQPDEALLLRLLVQELGLATAPRLAAGVAPGRESASDPDDTDVLPVASVGQGVEHLLADGVPRAGLARGTWPEAAPVPDLRLPLATMEPEHCGDRAPEATTHGVPDAD